MAITRYTVRRPTLAPWADIDLMPGRFARLFDDPIPGSTSAGRWNPAVSVSETNDELVLTAELPGLSEEDISVDFENSVLTIAGEKLDSRNVDEEDRNYHVFERYFGSFNRSFTLPRTVNPNDIVATFDKGILTVTLPKIAEAKGRKISITK
jgi:HSP20 family protein